MLVTCRAAMSATRAGHDQCVRTSACQLVGVGVLVAMPARRTPWSIQVVSAPACAFDGDLAARGFGARSRGRYGYHGWRAGSR